MRWRQIEMEIEKEVRRRQIEMENDRRIRMRGKR